MKQRVYLSVIVPSYKQEKTIKKDLKRISDNLSSLGISYEIIVVVDGFLDRTYKIIKPLETKKLKVLGYEKNQGKGYAVRHGMLQAEGGIIGFIDAGMDIDPEGITMLLNHMQWYDADIIVGSKLHPVSQVRYPLKRRILSWGWRTLTHLLFGFKVKDTQVGIKFFKRRVVMDVFPRLLVKKFAFDIEILALSYALGYKRIYEAPIKLNFTGVSSISYINLLHTIMPMLLDTIGVYYRVKIIKYYRKSNKKNWINS